MKTVIVIPDGCADEPQPSFGGRTPLQAARLPHMDRLAAMGVVGRTNNVPEPLTPASDVATLSLLGYDPLKVYTGRAPLEARALGVDLRPGDWAIRCNTVFVEGGAMRDFTAGHIASADGKELMIALAEAVVGPVPGGRIEFVPGVGYRNLLVFRADQPGSAPFGDGLKTQAPHDVPDQQVAGHLPTGPGSDLLRHVMAESVTVFADHPTNARRIADGKRPATQVWLWGQGVAPSLQPFAGLYGARGAISSGVDLVRGVGLLLGWDRIDAPGITDYLDTDYAAQAALALKHLPYYDVVCVHVEAPDEASHEGRAAAKIEALERIDEHIVGPLLDALPGFGEWRMLVSPDHRTPLRTRAHSYGLVPFAAAGTGIAADAATAYDEPTGDTSSLVFDPGWKLMGWLLSR